MTLTTFHTRVGSLDLQIDMELNPWGRRKGQVLHQMMYIPPLRMGDAKEVILWDTGSDTHYVREDFAKKQGFPFRLERCTTMTIGDHLEERTLPVYKCKIRDLKGRFLTFFSVALSRITGEMFCPLTGAQLHDLFPKVKDIESMSVKDPVDYLVGLD